MDGILTALWPLFALLLLGYLARRTDFPGAAFWPPAERATYYVLFPSLLVSRLSRAELGGAQTLQLVLAVLALLIIGTLILLLLRLVFRFPNAQFTSVYQGGMRFNTYVALAASAALIPGPGVALAAVVTAVMIPTLNLLCVLVFAWFGQSRPTLKGVLRTLATNPLILACLLGIALNLSGLGLPGPARPVLDLLGGMALPLGLLAVGAAIDLRMIRGSGTPVLIAIVVKLLLFPVLAVALSSLFELDLMASQVMLIFTAVPTATASYILARQLGGDAPMMANIITAQTLISMLTMPIMLKLLI
ncbi:putative membrane protein [Marinobacterium lacunae]|uniref:Putative membrane protein n=1 Tax=Marinobacterium lacunae TaxID=1232683 RepID=A0A081FY58_9GAMM|nr:AEC family transporter [Marinobacterium lacunae]KEA63463.1 putative membrane protein [Marinobacterium lacunae]MBR9884532.1 AEC family transporter [Oceanospirillales bacterium]